METRRTRAPTALTVALAILLGAPAVGQASDQVPADSADQPPFDGGRTYELVEPPPLTPPPGLEFDAQRVASIAARAVPGEAADSDRARIRTRLGSEGQGEWQVDFFEDGDGLAQVVVDDASGEVVEKWTGSQVDTKLARGYEGAVAGDVNEWWIWLPLCLLFLAPFVDPRRPFRMLHVDLIALLGFSASLFFFNRAEIGLSVALVYPVLAYVFVRMLIAGFRPRDSRERLVPLAPRGLLVAGIVALVAFHTAYVATEGKVIDVGLAGVIGADRLAHGDDVYTEEFSEGLPSSGDVRGDVYGPANYLAYVPFELALPWRGEWDEVSAARAAALGFELLTAIGLLLLGRRLRDGPEGTTLGIALAYAWLAYPFTMYTLASSFNDALVALLVVCCLLAISSPPARGALSAFSGLTKFGPLVLAPLFAAGTGERRFRPLALFGIAFVAAAAIVTLPLLPDGGLREVYDRSLGYQASRGSPFSVWGQAPSLDSLQTVAKVLTVGLGAAFFFVPKRRTTVQLAALAAALLIAVQVTANHWFYPYAVWFAPVVLVALFAVFQHDFDSAD
ncbi:MAG TPA: hypothetical protein VF052_10425 [Solirubrobacterales bacterium]